MEEISVEIYHCYFFQFTYDMKKIKWLLRNQGDKIKLLILFVIF